jgi:hypothetical protein
MAFAELDVATDLTLSKAESANEAEVKAFVCMGCEWSEDQQHEDGSAHRVSTSQRPSRPLASKRNCNAGLKIEPGSDFAKADNA